MTVTGTVTATATIIVNVSVNAMLLFASMRVSASESISAITNVMTKRWEGGMCDSIIVRLG